MSQNFSEMSDIYIPELMELDSYWQKAVEDAICDTLKGEKRLYYALKNRKKINQKLEMLGLSTSNKINFSGMPEKREESPQEKMSESDSEQSVSSREEETRKKSRSWSKVDEGSPLEKRPKTPDRPLLGNGSLEKMKKSQNSFNFEPMGVDNLNEEMSESENMEDFEAPPEMEQKEQNKKIQWLHVRDDSDFEKSDAENSDCESTNTSRINEVPENREFQKKTTLKDKNYFLNQKIDFRLPKDRSGKEKNTEPWEVGIQCSSKRNPDLERRLQLALAKRDIVNENLKATSIGNSCTEIEINGSAIKVAGKKRKGKQLLSPFIRFYLEVYRELCHKCSVKQIAEEAARRWWTMSPKEKSFYSKLRSKK